MSASALVESIKSDLVEGRLTTLVPRLGEPARYLEAHDALTTAGLPYAAHILSMVITHHATVADFEAAALLGRVA